MRVAKKAKKPVVKKPLTLRQVLNVIDVRLAVGDDTSKKLWDVLTALRGPDNSDCDLKRTTTIPIRRKALPKTTKGNRAPANFGYANNKFVESPMPEFTKRHFYRHAMAAGITLGLINEN